MTWISLCKKEKRVTHHSRSTVNQTMNEQM